MELQLPALKLKNECIYNNSQWQIQEVKLIEKRINSQYQILKITGEEINDNLMSIRTPSPKY